MVIPLHADCISSFTTTFQGKESWNAAELNSWFTATPESIAKSLEAHQLQILIQRKNMRPLFNGFTLRLFVSNSADFRPLRGIEDLATTHSGSSATMLRMLQPMINCQLDLREMYQITLMESRLGWDRREREWLQGYPIVQRRLIRRPRWNNCLLAAPST